MAASEKSRGTSWTRNLSSFVVGCALVGVVGCSSSTEGTPIAAGSEASAPASPSPTVPVRPEDGNTGRSPEPEPSRGPGDGSAGALPVPVGFDLPDGWQEVPPEEFGAAGAALTAIYPELSGGGLTPTIVVTGTVVDKGISLTKVAERAFEELRTTRNAEVEVEESDMREEGEISALTQVLNVSLPQGKIKQMYVCLTMPNAEDPERAALLEFSLTTLPQDFPKVVDDFREFVTSMHVEE
ncbi:hypothetical protein SacglDRAFT_01044 [Saccharomonospora glauca K62]|jgi:hypothetical protein|uniref:Lipoprotein LpqN n=1 Tax=Saccharomonospora glauca K62 TaxID=928724 RepID=I1CZ55_9PSEU|nr:hypothetical protein SacglDRAFT_01044 [Saccharomonospora glauca K62]